VIRALALLALVLPFAAQAEARLDLAALRPLAPLTELVIIGENHDSVPHPLTIRIDDRVAAAYADRINEERIAPPGRFTLRLRLALLRTPRQRPLDLAQAFRVIAFAPDGGQVDIAPLHLDAPAALPEGVHGWFFGPAAAMPLAGFESVVPGDPRVSGPHVEQVSRPGGDPVLAYGMRLTGFSAALPPGRWRLTLWTEDPGAWETLPVVLQQRIRANGVDLVSFNRDYQRWIAERSMAGRAVEADPAQPPFASLGARRGQRVTGSVLVGADGRLSLELAGFPQTATHLAMLTAEPADSAPSAEAAVEGLRATRFAESWPVLAGPPASIPVKALSLTAPLAGVTAPGGLAVLRFEARAPGAITARTALTWDGKALPANLYWGQWRWRRPGANAAGLEFSASHLRADAAEVTLRPDLPRRLVLVVRVPAGTKPGIYRGQLALTAQAAARAPFSVEVLPATRPAPRAQVGPFLGFAPHLLGSPDYDKTAGWDAARAQAACDLDTLSGLGFTALTAPLTPPGVSMDKFLSDIRAVSQKFPPSVLGYETLRAMAASQTNADTVRDITRIDAAIRAAGLPQVTWSIADEPAYNGITDQVRVLAEAIHAVDPAVRLAGHLNDARDMVLLPQLSMITVNQGFGADAGDIAAFRARGVRPWLYNMPRPRLSAGAYLWRSGADGLLQWHARMPTADAFDPTDGREGDVQFLWPTPGICAPADIDDDLLSLADGVEDLRWLAWLDAAARRDPSAARLRLRLHHDIPGSWNEAARLPAERSAAWRAEITDLARKLRY